MTPKIISFPIPASFQLIWELYFCAGKWVSDENYCHIQCYIQTLNCPKHPGQHSQPFPTHSLNSWQQHDLICISSRSLFPATQPLLVSWCGSLASNFRDRNQTKKCCSTQCDLCRGVSICKEHTAITMLFAHLCNSHHVNPERPQ